MPSDALDYITIKGFKSIAAIERLPLRPINILIGANGSGKSNFIGVFSFLHDVREGRLRDYVTAFGGAERLLHFGSKSTKEISFDISFAGGINRYELELSSTADDGLFPSEETVYCRDNSRYPPFDRHLLSPREQGREAGISNPNLGNVGTWVHETGGWRLYHLNDTSSSSPMRKTAKVDDNSFLRPDGSNLASFLFFLRGHHPDSYSLIQRAIQRVAPFFDDFDLKPLRLRADDIKLGQ